MRGGRRLALGVAAAGVLGMSWAAVGQSCGTPATTQLIAGSDNSVVAIERVPGTADTILTLAINGRLRYIVGGAARSEVALQISGFGSQSAGYGLAAAPDFATSGAIYVFGPEGSVSTLRRYRRSAADPNVFDPASELIFRLNLRPDQHGSGWIGFGAEGLLYIAIGEHTIGRENVQLRTSYVGKVLRIDPSGDDFPLDANRNYRIPSINPPATGAQLPEILAMGLRNPWRCSIDAPSGQMFIGDVGGSQREEVSVLALGERRVINFGWPCFEGTVPGPMSGPSCNPGSTLFMPPLFELPRDQSSCLVGGVVYRGSVFPGLRGQYVFASCSGSNVMAADVARPGVMRQLAQANSVYCVGVDGSGEMYLGTASRGVLKIVRLPSPFPDCNGNGLHDVCDIWQGYDTDVNRNSVPDACERNCSHDLDLNGMSNVHDVLIYLGLWHRGASAADFLLDGEVNAADVHAFIAAWFAGC